MRHSPDKDQVSRYFQSLRRALSETPAMPLAWLYLVGNVARRTSVRLTLRHPHATAGTQIDESHHEAELVPVISTETAGAEDRLDTPRMATRRGGIIHQHTLSHGAVHPDRTSTELWGRLGRAGYELGAA
jgi:hypothetical protein